MLEQEALRLDVLRAPSDTAADLVRSGVTVHHYEFAPVERTQELRLDEWLFPVREAAEAVTCLDILVRNKGEDSSGEAALRADYLPAGALPNLTELALSWETHEPFSSNSVAHGDDSNELAAEILAGLKRQETLVAEVLASLTHHKFLRHLRLEHPMGKPFPPCPNAVIEVADSDQISLRLKYLTWHSPCITYTQRYRVMSPAQRGTEARRSPLTIQLQRLPHMVGSRIDERGVWDRPRQYRVGNTIFNHSKFPPRALRMILLLHSKVRVSGWLLF
ncbi:hypothetical protein CF326_g6372 [Tilletia indica]|uniref:Uncharacterized protein n=1 Tax=Tilletia indica TaxID=43049 RepID=A0A177T8D9_9BASI|nr:hypothetical protein CF326_g6372 [Tilletia indica]KAE8241100.1 hypothetical protein A4X13_0g7562 [Tilletia indica]